MAALLYRLGRLSFRRRWTVLLIWVAVLGAVGFGAAKAPAAPDDGFSMPGIESQHAFDLMDQRFPGTQADGAVARVVFVAPTGQQVTSDHNKAAIERVVADAGADSGVAGAVDPFTTRDAVSADGSTAYATVTFKEKANDLSAAEKQPLEHSIQQARDAGLTVEVGGNALADQASAGGATEVIGIAIAAIVLLVTFGSFVAAGLPLLTAIVGVGISLAAITALGSTLGLSSTTGTLAMMLGLAVGIDYAVFVVSRYREERGRGHAPREAAGLAVGTAGSAVVFAGLTVVIALAGLSVVGIPMLTKMGLAAAGAVVVAVLVALTLVPALLGFAPRAVLSRKERKRNRRPAPGHGSAASTAADPVKENGGSRWARFVLRHPLPVLLAAVAGLSALALPVADLQLGMPGDEVKPTSSTERRAYDALAHGFGAGFNGPLTVVVDARGAQDPKAAVEGIEQRVAATEGVVSVSEARFNPAGDTAVFSAVPATGPSDAKTKQIVHTIRDERAAGGFAEGASFEVTGTTAMNIDIAQKVQNALVPYLVVVVGLAILLLLVVFRSLLVPLKAALGFLLSLLAALGLVVAVFQWGWAADLLGVESTGPIMSLMPIFMVGIVFGLAMDYEVFLLSRVREAYVHGDKPGPALVNGFRHSTRVVTAAALIMMAVFSGFVGADESMIKMIGFGLATAVLFDAFVVRMTIVPAVMALLGEKAWWMPRWLHRALPRVDIEGETLSRPVAPDGHESATIGSEGQADDADQGAPIRV
ncbi:MMPL family transporter [Yinghuangia aomiensis]|uniref:MMPL family transporter n=1 Tax=Yinghuangia aomiensis TaxID=676205 RepID=A0ABP9HXD1_9ACTN